MDQIARVEFAVLGTFVGVLLGMIAVATWKAFSQRIRTSLPRPHALTCLICGKKNKISSDAWEKACTTCRCGQNLYVPRLASPQEFPPSR